MNVDAHGVRRFLEHARNGRRITREQRAVGFDVRAGHDVDLTDLRLRHTRRSGGDELSQLLKHVRVFRERTGSGPFLRDESQGFGGRFAVFDGRCSFTTRLELLRFAIRFGRKNDVAVQTQFFQFGA